MGDFPSNFLWGAATSAFQTEGGNSNSDWWEWEKKVGLKDLSGDASGHYEVFARDFDLAKSLNHNAHRFSIEWSRIEPEEGKFNEKEIQHYKDVITELRNRNITPLVTLHHFTNPLWFSRLGGWENKNSYKYFLRYVNKLLEAYGELITYWITINEPLVYIYQSYLLGIWPPQKKSLICARIVENNLIKAHLEAYKLIHSFYAKNNLRPPLVSIAKNVQAFVPCRAGFLNNLAVILRNRFFNFEFMEKLHRKGALDFIGLNYYTRSVVEVKGLGILNILLDVCTKNHQKLEKNSLGWDIYPRGLYDLLINFRRFNLPIIITENGICTQNDDLRWRYIKQHLGSILAARNNNVDVRGYLYWSLIDNYEWDKGFEPRFGIIGVDYISYRRQVRQSANKLSEVIRKGSLTDD